MQLRRLLCVFSLIVTLSATGDTSADDWPMYGRDRTHNAVSPERNAPTDWDVGKFDSKTGTWVGSRNILWSAPLGSESFGDPVVADGQVWIGTNNLVRPNYERRSDASVLTGFEVRSGRSLFQYVSPRLPNRIQDFPSSPLACSPLIEGDLMWFTTNRCETVCLDLAPLKRGEQQPREVWKVDMMKQCGVYPIRSPMMWFHSCSIASFQNCIYVITGNGFDYNLKQVPAPEAPSLICFDKFTGKELWQDNSPGENILSGQWSSPLVIDAGGRVQVVVPQGDGWLRSFDAMTGKLIWKFDINLKTDQPSSKYSEWERGTRQHFLASPTLYQGRIFIAKGEHPQWGEGIGRLVCIDPNKTGDISSQLAMDSSGLILPDARGQTADLAQGHQVVSNPNSGLIWEYVSSDADGDGSIDFDERLAWVHGNVVIKDDLLVIADSSGVVHCLDARTGKCHWNHDTLAGIFASPLIVEDLVYVADEDKVSIFRLASDTTKPNAEINMQGWISASPIFANGVLFIATRDTLFAIQKETVHATAASSKESHHGYWPQWRGPNRDNISTESDLLKSWPENGPPLSWRVRGLGLGISTVSVSGGRVFTLSEFGTTEFIRALDEESGNPLWTQELGAIVPQNPSMRWLTQRPPTVDGDQVYAMSLMGELVCLRCSDGRLLWRRSYPTEFGGKSGLFGFSDCPLIYQDKLLCTPGGPEASIVALDKLSGKTIWTCAIPNAGGTAYSNGVIAILAGKLQLVAFLEKSLVGVDLEDGKLLWRSGRVTPLFSHPHTPLISGNLITCIYGTSAKSEHSICQIEIEQRDGLFFAREIYCDTPKLNFSRHTDDTIQLADQIYETDNGIFNCFDLKSKSPLWRNRLTSRATITFAGGQFYFHGSDGEISLVEAGLKEPVVKSKFMLPDHQTSNSATTPVVAGGHLFIREDDLLFRYDIRANAKDRDRSQPNAITLEIPIPKTASPDRDRILRSVFVPTPQKIVEEMLKLARVQATDVVYDLGSGDGRIVITAAQTYSCRAVGYEIDPQLVALSRAKASEANVDSLVTIEQADLFTAQLGNATVIAVYLLPAQLEKLLPQFEKLLPGTRIVSHYFELPGFVADETLTVHSQEDGNEHKLHRYSIPLHR